MSKADGKYIAIQFTQPLTNDLSSVNASAFTVTGQQYDKQPGGVLVPGNYLVDSVGRYDSIDGDIVLEGTRTILLTMKDLNRFHNVAGDLTVAYDGSGGLLGAGGAVAAFSVPFTPENLVIKPNPHDEEHMEIDVSATGTLTRIYYTDTTEQDQGHISISSITAVCNLINVDDL